MKRTAIWAVVGAGLVLGVGSPALAQTVTGNVFNFTGTFNTATDSWNGLANLQFVTVGNPGNPADTSHHGFSGWPGSVAYTYKIGTFDVTSAQYCAFLNAVATRSDPYGLYNSCMGTGQYGYVSTQIRHLGNPGSYSYCVDPNWANRPVTFVSWGDAARFCNWLNNGQPTGSEGAGTTETGSYPLNGAVDDANLEKVVRSANAHYVIPTESEWYKAAYYCPQTNSYYGYPNQYGAAPANQAPPGGNSANYRNGNYVDPSHYTTEVGAYFNSESCYGAFDMGGNVFQWVDANTYAWGYQPNKIGLGGAFDTSLFDLTPAGNCVYTPSFGVYDLGFRVVALPEPTSMAGMLIGGAWILSRRRMREKKGQEPFMIDCETQKLDTVGRTKVPDPFSAPQLMGYLNLV